MWKSSTSHVSPCHRVVLGVVIATFMLGCSDQMVSWISHQKDYHQGNKKVKHCIIFNISGSLVEQEDFNPLLATADFQGSRYTPVRRLVTTLNYASKDPNIKLVVLDFRNMKPSSLVSVVELYRALQSFKESGKKIYSYSYGYGLTSYLLASLSDQIWLDSLGKVAIDGLLSSMPFYLRAMEKYGINAYVFKAGQFKSAVEPFTSSEMSPELRQQHKQLLQDQWDGYTSLLLNNKRFTNLDFHKYVEDRPKLLNEYQGDEASLSLDKGLIDRVGTWDDLETCLTELGYEKEHNRKNDISYLEHAVKTSPNESSRKSLPRIAVVYATGQIMAYVGQRPHVMDADALIKNLKVASEHPKTKVIILRVDTPGGDVGITEKIFEAIIKARRKVPIIVSGAGGILSGGYWLSLAANEIWAEERTLVGSIGVFGMFLNAYKILEKHGITEEIITTHAQSGVHGGQTGWSTLPPPNIVQEMIQNNVNFIYKKFLNRVVSTGKAKDLEAADNIAQGKVYTGKRALDLGLLDGVGSFNAVLKRAAELADLKEYVVVVCNSKRGLLDTMLSFLKNPMANGVSWFWNTLKYQGKGFGLISPFLDYMDKNALNDAPVYALSEINVLLS